MEVAAGDRVSVMCWQLLPGQLLTHRSWQDETVLFNDLSGDTHLLGADALALLFDLRDGPITADELGGDDGGTRALLDHLVALGLVEQAPC